MNDYAKKGPRDYLITIIAVGMSLYHLNIAFTGGYEPLFQRSLSLLFALVLIFLIYLRPVPALGRHLNAALAGALVLLAILSVGYVLFQRDYFLDRFPYIHPLRWTDLIFGTATILLVLEAARRATHPSAK